MSNTYTKDSENIYFLNDKNIVTSLQDTTAKTNPVASYDVVKGISDDIRNEIDNMSYDVSVANGYIVSHIKQSSGKITCDQRILKESDIFGLTTDLENISGSYLLCNDFTSELEKNYKIFEYDKYNHKFNLTLGNKNLSIDIKDVLTEDVIESVKVITREDGKKYIQIIFKDQARTDIEIPVESLVQVYKPGDGIIIDNNLCLIIDDTIARELSVANRFGIVNEKIGEISNLNTKTLKFNGHFTDATQITAYNQISDVFGFFTCETNKIDNGSFFSVNDSILCASTICGDFVVGSGDYVIIHDHDKNVGTIDSKNLKVGTNVFIIKGGVSRYEFNQVSNLIDERVKALSTSYYESDDINKLSDNYVNGDVAVIKKVISGDISHWTAYRWGKLSGETEYSWKALDGNYSAKNVYLEDDLILAGDYTLGNIKKQTSDLCSISKGTSVESVLEQMFTEEKEPTKVNGGSISIQITNNTQYEVGTYVLPKYKLTFSSGEFSYGSIDSLGNWSSGTGIRSSVLSIGDSVGNKFESVNSGTIYTSTISAQLKDVSDTVVSAYGYWLSSDYPSTNMHKKSKTYSPKSAESSTKTAQLTCGYRCMFAGSYTSIQSTVDSSTIRGLQTRIKAEKCDYSSGKFKCTVVEGAWHVLMAVPKKYTITKVKNSLNQDVDIEGPNIISVKGEHNYDGTDYNVYYIKASTPMSKEEYTITVS